MFDWDVIYKMSAQGAGERTADEENEEVWDLAAPGDLKDVSHGKQHSNHQTFFTFWENKSRTAVPIECTECNLF